MCHRFGRAVSKAHPPGYLICWPDESKDTCRARVGLKNQTERNTNECNYFIISWLRSHMDEKFFLPQSWHLSFASFSELVLWQLNVGGENHTTELD